MADLSIASAAALTGATLAGGDLLPVLDVSASAGSKGSRITVTELFTGRALAGTSALGLLNGGTGAYDLTLAHNGTLTAGRTLTLNVQDAARTLTLGGNLTVPATGTAALLGTANVFTALQTTPSVEFTAVSSALASASTMRLSNIGFSQFEMASPTGKLSFLVAGSYAAMSGSGWFDMGIPFGLTSGTGGTNRVWLINKATDSLQLGMNSASSQVSQIFSACGARIGTDTNTTPTNTLTIAGPHCTGTGTGGNLILGVYGTNGVSGTAIGALNTVVTIVAARKVLNVAGIPTSASGLSSGDVYSNSGVLTLVP